jgi:hypothetical protein
VTIDAGRMINALVEAELTAERWERSRYIPRGNVVTLAHDRGSGGREVGRRLAARLGVEYYDKEILDAIIEAVPQDRILMERLDKQVSHTRDEVMRQIIFGQSALDEYRRQLIDVVLNIGRKSGVIVGRNAAPFILANHKAFRVRIVGSPDVCAGRLAERERIPVDEARQQVLQAREDHAAFCKQLCGRDLNEPEAYDLILNTDRVPLESAVGSILHTMQGSGFEVPKESMVAQLKKLLRLGPPHRAGGNRPTGG